MIFHMICIDDVHIDSCEIKGHPLEIKDVNHLPDAHFSANCHL